VLWKFPSINYIDFGDEHTFNSFKGEEKVLYTAGASVKIDGMKVYRLIRNHENDAVVPDLLDVDQYLSGMLTWEGLRVSYLAKLMRSEAEEWMRRVSAEAVSHDVVLVSDERDYERSCRGLLAEMMMSMFSGEKSLRYAGELKEAGSSS
jgi:hypothetical protein